MRESVMKEANCFGLLITYCSINGLASHNKHCDFKAMKAFSNLPPCFKPSTTCKFLFYKDMYTGNHCLLDEEAGSGLIRTNDLPIHIKCSK